MATHGPIKMLLIETDGKDKYKYLMFWLNFYSIMYIVKKLCNIYQIFCNMTESQKKIIMKKIKDYNKNVQFRRKKSLFIQII
jgi:hypothetical protein